MVWLSAYRQGQASEHRSAMVDTHVHNSSSKTVCCRGYATSELENLFYIDHWRFFGSFVTGESEVNWMLVMRNGVTLKVVNGPSHIVIHLGREGAGKSE